MAKLEVRLFGSLDVFLDKNNITEAFRTAKERALFAYLLTHASRPQSRETLAELFWPERPGSSARTNLRQAFYKIRRGIGLDVAGHFFISSDESIHFDGSTPHTLDVAIFQNHYREILKHEHEILETCDCCSDKLKEAIDLYRGEFLEGIFVEESTEFQEWAIFNREKYFQQYLNILQKFIDINMARGTLEIAHRYALKQVQVAPLEEEGYRQLMIILNAMGRRSSAIEQFSICQTRLMEEIGVQPAVETRALYEKIKTGRIPTRPRTPFPTENEGAPNTLPTPLSSFFGRENELADLNTCLKNVNCRLITLVGMGGVGKTRLAIQAARQAESQFFDGIWFIPLDKIGSVPHLQQALIRHLNVPRDSGKEAKTRLFHFFQKRCALLVLDSFEQVLSATGFLIELLHNAPGLKILVTSRERLNYQTACYFAISGLPYPDDCTMESPQSFPAVELFLTRLQQRQLLAVHDQWDICSVLKICELVDGLPLGLELAAAEAQGRSLKHFASLLEQSLELLKSDQPDVPHRQQNIRTVFEQSWISLAESEKRVFASLPIFKGNFSMEAASAVTRGSLETLSNLVDKSLLENVSFSRFSLHPLLRMFATEKQNDFPGIHEQGAQSHCSHFLTYALSQQENLKRGIRLKDTLDEFKTDYTDLAQAWFCAVSNHKLKLVDGASEIFYIFFDLTSKLEEGARFFRDAVPLLKGSPHPETERITGKLISYQAWFLARSGKHKDAISYFKHCIAILKKCNGIQELVFPLFGMGFVLRRLGLFEEAQSYFEKSEKAALEAGDEFGEAIASLYHLETQIEAGTASQPRDALIEILSTFENLGHIRGSVRALTELGDLACENDNYYEGEQFYKRALTMVEKMEEPWATAIILLKLANTALRAGSIQIARERYEKCREIFHNFRDQWRLARVNIALGALALQDNRPELAGGYLKSAVQIGLDLDSKPLLFEALTGIGELYAATQAEKEKLSVKTFLAYYDENMQSLPDDMPLSAEILDSKPPNGSRSTDVIKYLSPNEAANDFLNWWFARRQRLGFQSE